MDNLQIKIKNTIEAYPETLNDHLVLKRVMADVFESEREKAKAFCLAFGLGIVDVCKKRPDNLRDIYESLVDDYFVSANDSKWVLYTWCEVFEISDYKKYFAMNSINDMIENLLGDSTNRIINHIEHLRVEQEEEQRRIEEEKQRKLLEQAKVEDEFSKYRDGSMSTDVIEMYKALYLFLKRKQICLEMVNVQLLSSTIITITSNPKRISINSNVENKQFTVRINEEHIMLSDKATLDEKRCICAFLKDINTCKQIIEGLKRLLDVVAKTNFKQCKIAEDICTIMNLRIEMKNGKVYRGNKLIN